MGIATALSAFAGGVILFWASGILLHVIGDTCKGPLPRWRSKHKYCPTPGAFYLILIFTLRFVIFLSMVGLSLYLADVTLSNFVYGLGLGALLITAVTRKHFDAIQVAQYLNEGDIIEFGTNSHGSKDFAVIDHVYLTEVVLTVLRRYAENGGQASYITRCAIVSPGVLLSKTVRICSRADPVLGNLSNKLNFV